MKGVLLFAGASYTSTVRHAAYLLFGKVNTTRKGVMKSNLPPKPYRIRPPSRGLSVAPGLSNSLSLTVVGNFRRSLPRPLLLMRSI